MIKNITEIKAKSNIIDIIGSFLILKKSGANYSSPCPFHNEKSASFIVSPAKQIFTCFGCGKSGDVFKFLQEYKQLSFQESVEAVGELSGVNIEYETNKNTAHNKDKRQELNAQYESLFVKATQELLANEKILQYLYNRGLTQEDLNIFSIGLMPSLDSIRSIYDTQTALQLGILKKRTDGSIYTPFKNRIIFAIRNNAHKIVGLSGRTHPYENFRNAPKYLNSGESFLFKKSENLYLFSLAKSAIKQNNSVIIVEGYMDCIALHKMGFTNAVATCGTAFNLAHLNALYRINQEIELVFCFDSDEAGKKATIRSLELCFSHKFYNVKTMLLKGNHKDIGEILEKKAQLECNVITGLKFYIGYHFKQAKDSKAKDDLLKYLVSLIDNEQNFYAKLELIDNISSLTHIPKEYFYTKKAQSYKSNHNRILELLYSIYNDKDCAYIAKKQLDLDSIDEHYKADLEHFLNTEQLQGSALNIALNDKLNTNLNISSVYNEILNLNITQASKNLDIAKIKKDIPQIIALSEYITKCKEEIQCQDNMF